MSDYRFNVRSKKEKPHRLIGGGVTPHEFNMFYTVWHSGDSQLVQAQAVRVGVILANTPIISGYNPRRWANCPWVVCKFANWDPAILTGGGFQVYSL